MKIKKPYYVQLGHLIELTHTLANSSAISTSLSEACNF